MIVVAIIGILAAVAIPAFMDYMKKSKKSEASLQLNKIAKNAKAYYITNASFPATAAALTPTTSCCAQNYDGKSKKCQAQASDWTTPEWRELDFQVDEPHYFQYEYNPASSGASFTAYGVGNLDCDATSISYTLVGAAPNGNPAMNITEPSPNSD